MHTKTQNTKTNSRTEPATSSVPVTQQPLHPVLQLQQLLGNQAVQRLLQPKHIQAKLRIGAPDDIYEQETDRSVGQEMSMPDPKLQRQAENREEKEIFQDRPLADQVTPLVQRQNELAGEEEGIQAKTEKQGSVASPDYLTNTSKTDAAHIEAMFTQPSPGIHHDTLQAKTVSTQSSHNTPQPFVQRMADNEQDEFKEEEEEGNTVQTKLTIGQPNDPYEQEANRVADQLVQNIQNDGVHKPYNPRIHSISTDGIKPELQKKSPGTRQANSDFIRQLDSMRGTGHALAPQIQQYMENQFNVDFSDVRIHTNSASEQLNRDISARAFTHKKDIFFNTGEYQPHTREGQHLLAHELTHVVQQSGDSVARIQREGSPPEPANEKNSAYRFYGKHFNYYIRNNIQWHVNITGWYIDLILFFDDPKLREIFSDWNIAEASVQIWESSTGTTFKPGQRFTIVDSIAKSLGELERSLKFYRIPFWIEKFTNALHDEEWSEYKEQLRQSLGGSDVMLNGELLAAGDLPSKKSTTSPPKHKGKGKIAPPIPRWASKLKSNIRKKIEKARSLTPRPRDLPDRVVLWFSTDNESWYFNVWVYRDTRVRIKYHHIPIRLREGEKSDSLFHRVRAATRLALQQGEDKQQRKRASELAPAWALQLERELKRRLRRLRAIEETDDFPDGMVVVPGADVYLRIWVERGKAPKTERRYADVPLLPNTTVDLLVPYVRRVSAILRQFEQTPTSPPPTATTTPLDPDKLRLSAFPAEIRAVDMRKDNITVTGAKNEFHMQMNYEAVYGGGQIKDLFIASKLYQQYIHFFWEVYPIPTDLPPADIRKKQPSWGHRWMWLYDAFNPPVDKQGHKPARQVSISGSPMNKSDGPESSTRVEMPSTPGDYLVRCVTAHTPIGETKLKRSSSEAYYPVRVRPIEEVAKGAASLRPEAIKEAEEELKDIDKLLATGKLHESERQLLLSRQQYRRGDLERLKRKETQTLGKNLSEEIDYATTTREHALQLNNLLPKLRERAKAEGVAPSSLLADKPDLLSLYWYLISEGKTAENYAEELKRKITQLQGVHKRAGEFTNELKTSSPYRYSLEAAFVSELTGHVYPLVMMLGEAPDSVRAAAQAGGQYSQTTGVAYSLIDVTSSQTQKVYYGYSSLSGPEGHHEAIKNAFENFGEDATYGEGLIAVRIAQGSVSSQDPNHPGTDIKTFRSEEGILQKALWALGIIGAVAGLAALVATGVGAPAAAGILGVIAATAGAITSLHNIGERRRRHKLELDAELILDIVSIISVIPATAGARVAIRTAAGLRTAVMTQRFLQIYTYTELGTTVILIPTKLAQDIQRIENDPELDPEQKRLMIAQARLGALQSGLMMLGSVAAAHAGAPRKGGGFVDENSPAMRNQIEMLEMEGFGHYKTMQERGWLDTHGNWTKDAPDIVHSKPKTPEIPPTKPPAKTGGGPHPTSPAPGKEPGRQFRFRLRTIDEHGKLTDEGVKVLKEKFPHEFIGDTDQQIRDAFARDITIGRRGRFHEALVKFEFVEYYKGSKGAFVTTEGRRFKTIFRDLESRAPGKVKDDSVLKQKAGDFAETDPILRKAIYELDTHPSETVREIWKSWYTQFKRGLVGNKQPDIIEFLPDRNLAVVSDPTLAVPSEFGPVHSFKTLFYQRVLARVTGFEVGSMDIAPGLITLPGP